MPLNRQNMLLAVFQIIAENVPNLRGLNLSNNNIFSTEHFSMLKRHAPDLEMLDLSNNKVRGFYLIHCWDFEKSAAPVPNENVLRSNVFSS